MECLLPTVMNNYLTCFRLLTHLGVNNIWTTGVLNKNSIRKSTIFVGKQSQKKECGNFGQRTSSKKSSATWQWLVWTTREWCTLFLLNFLNLRDLFDVWIRLKESIFKKNNQINFAVTTRAGFFQKDGPERFQVQDWYPIEKMVVFPVCLMFDVSMLDVVLQNAWVV